MLVLSKTFKIKLTILILIVTSYMNAQERWMLGLAPSLELQEDFIGINSRLYYGINEHICFGPEVTFFPYQDIENGYELTITDLNFNAHYIFELTHNFGFYPLSGVNYTIEKERLIEQPKENDSEEKFGWNYGFGAHYNLSKVFVFAEFKGVSGKLSDEFITIGVIFPLAKHKKEHQEEHQ